MSQKGFTLIEVLVAMAIMGILAVAVPCALSTASRTIVISNEQTLAESLARSQVDSILNQNYDKTNNPPVYSTVPNLPAGYSIATPLAARMDPKGDGTGNDDGLQQITVVVKHGTKTVYTLVDYKVNLKQ
jgi:prepilin-type N-terminal cleavage/methylation domain-containing protein